MTLLLKVWFIILSKIGESNCFHKYDCDHRIEGWMKTFEFVEYYLKSGLIIWYGPNLIIKLDVKGQKSLI